MNTTVAEYDEDNILFHFTKKETAIERILPTGMLKFSILKDFNDPYEYKQNPKGAPLSDDINANQAFEAFNINYERYNNYVLNKIKILSFSINKHPNQIELGKISQKINKEIFPFPLEEPYKNLRMWNQYGDNQFGVCLVFHKDKLISQIKSNFFKYRIKTKPIHYCKNSSLPIVVIPNILGDNVNIINENIKNVIDEILSNKSFDFLDEQEYRIWIHDPYENINSIEIKSSIKGIILGDRFPADIYCQLIREFCKKYNINWHHAKFSSNRFLFYQGKD